MTYPGSRSHLWVPGERVDDTVLNEWAPKNVAWGKVNSVNGTAAQSGITTLVDVTGSALAVSYKAGRQYSLFGWLTMRWTTVAAPITNAAYADILIRNNAGTQFQAAQAPADGSGTGLLGWRTVRVETWLTPGADGSDTFKLSIQRSVTCTAGVIEIAGSWGLALMDMGLQTP